MDVIHFKEIDSEQAQIFLNVSANMNETIITITTLRKIMSTPPLRLFNFNRKIIISNYLAYDEKKEFLY